MSVGIDGNSSQRIMAQTLFALEVYRARGDSFQDLFWAVMKAQHGEEFVTIQPQGRRGDGGNDGFHPTLGRYFQIYGPMNPEGKVAVAVKKLTTDFSKILDAWHHTFPVQRYSFAYNDKYRGSFPEIVLELGNLQQKHSIPCLPFTAEDLEREFLALPQETWETVLHRVFPDIHAVRHLAFSELKQLIRFIMDQPATTSLSRWGELPELSEKIKLNQLNAAWGDVIKYGHRRAGRIDEYFSRSLPDAKVQLQRRIVGTYCRIRDEIRKETHLPAGVSRADLVFAGVREAPIPPQATEAVLSTLDTVLGYYFESCDYFDPYAKPSEPNASP